MSKKYKILIILFTALMVLFSSCKSKPEPQPTVKPQPEKVEEEKTTAKEVEPEKKEEKKAEKKPAEKPVKKPKPAKPKDNKEAKFLAEIKKLESQKGPLKTARTRAIKLKANKNYPEQFGMAEKLVKSAKQDVKDAKYEKAIEKYKEAIDRYDTLSNLMEAAEMRAEIEENNFAKFLPEAYVEAERLSINSLDLYELDAKLAKETSEDAVKLYKKVVDKGYFEYSSIAKQRAKESKADCDSIKVARSRTKEYNKAVRNFNLGKKEETKASYKTAFKFYKESAELFLKLYEEVLPKREAAEKAMAEAAKKRKETTELAKEADKEAPLTEVSEGFNQGDLKLEDKTSPKTATKVEKLDETEEELKVDEKKEPENPSDELEEIEEELETTGVDEEILDVSTEGGE